MNATTSSGRQGLLPGLRPRRLRDRFAAARKIKTIDMRSGRRQMSRPRGRQAQ